MHRLVSLYQLFLAGIFLTIAILAIGTHTTYAQIPDKDHGASIFAPKEAQPLLAGGWDPMERPPSCDGCEAVDENPGKEALGADLIGNNK